MDGSSDNGGIGEIGKSWWNLYKIINEDDRKNDGV